MDEKKVIKRIGVISLGKIFGVLYAVFGLIAGIFIAIASLAGGFSAGISYGAGFFFGLGSVIIFPIIYGIMGFVGGIITAAIYNLVAGVAGGLEIEVETGY